MNIRFQRSLLACALAAGIAVAQAGQPSSLELTTASFMEVDAQLKSAQGHPNEEWRLNGLKSYLSGHYDEAADRFERAAGYADKYAEHYLSLMYWYGQGVPQDRARAYIWSDLAAERGSRRLLAIREKMWAGLNADERAQVDREGPGFYERYGDSVAKPRAEAEIRRFARTMTGSRVGYRSQAIAITQGGPINGAFSNPEGNAGNSMQTASQNVVGTTTAEKFYADDRIVMTDYWNKQDAELENSRGRVDVGPVARSEPPRH